MGTFCRQLSGISANDGCVIRTVTTILSIAASFLSLIGLAIGVCVIFNLLPGKVERMAPPIVSLLISVILWSTIVTLLDPSRTGYCLPLVMSAGPLVQLSLILGGIWLSISRDENETVQRWFGFLFETKKRRSRKSLCTNEKREESSKVDKNADLNGVFGYRFEIERHSRIEILQERVNIEGPTSEPASPSLCVDMNGFMRKKEGHFALIFHDWEIVTLSGEIDDTEKIDIGLCIAKDRSDVIDIG